MNCFAQFENLVPQAAGVIDWPGLLDLLPLAGLANVMQDPLYHREGDVLTHTRMVCESLLALPEYASANKEQQLVLFYAALLHDLGKAACTRVEEDGRISSAGHSRRGAVDVRVLLWRAGFPFALRERICRIIACHQIPLFALRGSRGGESAEFLMRRLSCELPLLELITVARADMLGRICDDTQSVLDDMAVWQEMANEEACLELPRSFADTHTRLAYFRSGGSISPDYPHFQSPGSSVIVMSGLPASGKDTWVARHAGGMPIISFDDARDELGLKHGSHAGAAVHLATDRARELLRQQRPFVWNATHLSAQMRKKTLDLLYAYDAQVEIVYLESPEKVIKSRNTRRDSTLTNAAIDKMLYRWEVPLETEAHSVRYLAEN